MTPDRTKSEAVEVTTPGPDENTAVLATTASNEATMVVEAAIWEYSFVDRSERE